MELKCIDSIGISKKRLVVDGSTFKNSREFFFVCKRIADIFISLVVIIFFLSWLIPILAILIKLDSKGPVLFIQKRIGALGKPFNCFKLRSMVENTQAHTKQATVNDERITSFGKFLRRSCFDELPQFFNVLFGQMSIVGPRPHMIKDCEEFSKYIDDYNLRHLVKPGITGIAQVKGLRGETSNFYDISSRFEWDMFYVNNACFLLDLKIAFKTILQIIYLTFSVNKESQTIVEPLHFPEERLIKEIPDQLLEVEVLVQNNNVNTEPIFRKV